MLKGKKIILGVSGSIAAYKSAILCRSLVKEGCEVKVVMTEAAKSFITPLTMSTLSGHEVITAWDEGDIWKNHVDLGLWADLMIIAPSTANTLAKMANGQCDNMLMAVYLSAKCPIMVCPAMDLDMWAHHATKRNIELLKSYGHHVIPVGYGLLASGLIGDGRMTEPEEIVAYVNDYFQQSLTLSNKKVLITAGPTYEAIDPVRFIGNYSSGKMGYALAKACADRGAEVTLVSGPTKLQIQHERIRLVKVTSAQEMFEAANSVFETSDISILAAAVADYKPSRVADQKIKKSDTNFSIDLVKTVDIAASLGSKKKENQVIVGFALETNNEINHAQEKLHKKNMNFIVLNSLKDLGAGFMHDTNKITILDHEGHVTVYELKNKEEVAKDILDYLSKYI
ncbi:MAG: bifunctional phosphopantothenoylcysteine decarboxylase/phosphopantothenate--cysteine ligase CoaBC [Chitinophagales bacterium]|nr:bifunctional phosphopantothenoylcysteine decarboxylase/phosphopantothenate--cysteine ligase CoaBC [Chitinophagales bacterium]